MTDNDVTWSRLCPRSQPRRVPPLRLRERGGETVTTVPGSPLSGVSNLIKIKNNSKLKFSKTFSSFSKSFSSALQASELNFVIYFYINKSSLTNETNQFLLPTNSKGSERNKLKLQILNFQKRVKDVSDGGC